MELVQLNEENILQIDLGKLRTSINRAVTIKVGVSASNEITITLEEDLHVIEDVERSETPELIKILIDEAKRLEEERKLEILKQICTEEPFGIFYVVLVSFLSSQNGVTFSDIKRVTRESNLQISNRKRERYLKMMFEANLLTKVREEGKSVKIFLAEQI